MGFPIDQFIITKSFLNFLMGCSIFHPLDIPKILQFLFGYPVNKPSIIRKILNILMGYHIDHSFYIKNLFVYHLRLILPQS